MWWTCFRGNSRSSKHDFKQNHPSDNSSSQYPHLYPSDNSSSQYPHLRGGGDISNFMDFGWMCLSVKGWSVLQGFCGEVINV